MSNKAVKRKPGRRGVELLLLVAVVALVVHFVRVRRQAELAEQERLQQAAEKATVEFYDGLSEDAKDGLAIFGKAIVTGAKYGYESRERRQHRVELLLADRQLKKDPNDVEWLRRRAIANWQLDEQELSVRDIRKILTLAPNDSHARLCLAHFYAERDEHTTAVSELDKILKTDPDNAFALNNRAFYLAELGYFQEALADANRTIQIRPLWTNGHGTLGYILVGLGNYQVAIDSYSRAITFDPNSKYALRGRAVAYRKLGKLELSQEDLDACRALDPSFCLHWKLDNDPGDHADDKNVLVN